MCLLIIKEIEFNYSQTKGYTFNKNHFYFQPVRQSVRQFRKPLKKKKKNIELKKKIISQMCYQLTFIWIKFLLNYKDFRRVKNEFFGMQLILLLRILIGLIFLFVIVIVEKRLYAFDLLVCFWGYGCYKKR